MLLLLQAEWATRCVTAVVMVALAVAFVLVRARCPLGLVLNQVTCYKV